MPALTLGNLILYAAQAALLIGGLALVLAGLRPSPGFRLAACRMVLLALLVLPGQVLLRTPVAEPATVPVTGAAALATDSIEARATKARPWGTIAGSVIVAGALLRLLWLGAGLARLTRLSRRLPEAETADEVDALQAELGTRALVRFSPDLRQPVTFGVAPAIVLLPAALREASTEQRLAVICHELLHVRRRDWPWVLVEEAVLALLWFHPAVWWLVGELQLAREQVVDRLTVAATGARRAYMDALFSAADAPSAPPLLAGFLRRRHLARRLVALAEEVVMSRARLALSGVLVFAVLIGSGAVAMAAWPLVPGARDDGQEPVMAFQPRPDGPGQLAVLHREPIDVPGGLTNELTNAAIVLDLVVDARGSVTSARPSSVAIRNVNGAQLSATDLHSLDAMLGSVAAGSIEVARPGAFTDRAAIVRDVETMAKTASAALTQWRFAPPVAAPAIVRLSTRFDLEAGRVMLGQPQPISGFSGVPGPTSTFVVRSAEPPKTEGVLRVGGAIRPPQKVVNVAPEYPDAALEAKVEGVVVLGLTVAADGTVSEAWVLKSIPLLDEAALKAVQQWRYEPTLMNGGAVPVQMTVTVNFTLSQ